MTDLELWRDNRVDQRWQISLADLADQFLASSWAAAEMRADRALAGFISAKDDGLSSVWEDTDVFDAALAVIRERRNEVRA